MRHRALQLFLRQALDVGSTDCALLHVAPEPALAKWLSTCDRIEYVSVDLSSRLATVKGDITALPFVDNRFDLILCLHVLEHVLDDRAAMRELFRVLRPGGTAVIQVPPSALLETLEDASVVRPRDRKRRFGQYDHVRICGADYQLRLSAAGFDVRIEDYVARLTPLLRAFFVLRTGEPFYLCNKPHPLRTSE